MYPVISARLKEVPAALYNDTLLHYHARQKNDPKYTHLFLPLEFQEPAHFGSFVRS